MNITALAVGCLSPDFVYFLRLSPRGHFGHTLPGIFALDLPLSIAVLWLYLRFLRAGLCSSAPAAFPFSESEISTQGVYGTKSWLIAAVSILLGAVTHIAWDSFTHPTFWPYAHFQWMHVLCPLPFGRNIEMYKLLQHISGLLGIAVLLSLWFRWIHEKNDPGPLLKPLGGVLFVLAALGAVIRIAVSVSWAREPYSLESLAGEALVVFFTVLWVELVLVGMLRRREETRRRSS